MDELAALCAKIAAQWKTLATSRAGEEGSLDSAIGQKGSFGVYTSAINQWLVTLNALKSANKRRTASTLPIQQSLKHAFNGLLYALGSSGNGVQWLIDERGLTLHLALSESLVATLDRECLKERGLLVDAAKTELADQLTQIESGALAGDAIAARVAQLELSIEQVATAHDVTLTKKSEIEAITATLVETLNALIADTEKENKDSRQTISKDLVAIKAKAESVLADATGVIQEKLKAIATDVGNLNVQITSAKALTVEISNFHSTAQTVSSDALAAKEKAVADLARATNAMSEAEQKEMAARNALNAALQNVRRQGLSGAFFEKVVDVKEQHRREQWTFNLSLGWLALVGSVGLGLELWQGTPQGIEQWLMRLMRLLLLATPGVWIAWLAAKRLGALNRILSDYEFKSATALAFDSYRQEIESSGNAELGADLLRTAVATFGENPTRYYDSSKDDAVMPSEHFLDKFRRTTEKPKGVAVTQAISEPPATKSQ